MEISDDLGNVGIINVDCNYPLVDGCLTLSAAHTQIKMPTTYTVQSIPYAPTYPFQPLSSVVANIDDAWGNYTAFPANFDFCFYGGLKNFFQVGTNGVISFNNNGPANQGFTCDFSLGEFEQLENANVFRNAIMLFHDIDPSVSRSPNNIRINYQIFGTAPCRVLVVAFNNVPHYLFATDSNVNSTFQFVLYETTNIIDVNIQSKPFLNNSSYTNSGRAVLGIQNPAGNIAHFPTSPNRNTGHWGATNEAWRFLPNGANVTTAYNWKDENNITVGTSSTLEICPTDDEIYTLDVIFTRCGGDQILVSSSVAINYTADQVITTPINVD